MRQNDSIVNNSYNNMEFGMERTRQNANISIDPGAADLYEEATTNDISEVYTRRKIEKVLSDAFINSKYYEKYGKGTIDYDAIKKGVFAEGVEVPPDLMEKTEFNSLYDDAEESDDNYTEGEEEKPTEKKKLLYSVPMKFKKVERSEMTEIYYYFKNILVDENNFNEVDAFCAIAEFFKFNYKTLFDDIISIENKAKILNILKEKYGLTKEFQKTPKLF